MPNPNEVKLTFEFPRVIEQSETEAEFFRYIVNNPKTSGPLAGTYQSALKEDKEFAEFTLYKNIQVGHNARTSDDKFPIWHTDGHTSFKNDTKLITMSTSSTTKNAEGRVLIDIGTVADEEYSKRFLRLKNKNRTSTDVLRAVYAIGYILGERWVEMAMGEVDVDDKFKEGSASIQILELSTCRAEPFLIYGGKSVKTLHRAVLRTPTDQQQRLWLRYFGNTDRENRPSDQFIEQLMTT